MHRQQNTRIQSIWIPLHLRKGIAFYISNQREKSGPFLPGRISGKCGHVIQTETQNPCPSNLWGQGFVHLNAAAGVSGDSPLRQRVSAATRRRPLLW